MKIGWWMLIVSTVFNCVLGGAVAFLLNRVQGAEGKLTQCQEKVAALKRRDQALDKLQVISLRLGTEPVHISGEMWVVLEGSVQ